jgi:hypothetical protein
MSWPAGVGRVVALMGLVITIVLLIIGQLALKWDGLLFLLAFLALLL